MSSQESSGLTDAASQILDVWVKRLSQDLQRVAGITPEIQRLGELRVLEDAERLWWIGQPGNAAFSIVVGAEESEWRALGDLLIKGTAVASPSRDNLRHAYLKLLDGLFEMRGSAVDRRPPSEQFEVVEIRFPMASAIRLLFQVQARRAHPDSTLDLLLRVELPVTIRLGAVQMYLHDLLKISPGSALEFDRRVNDPVEILVNGRIVAIGEAVVVRGSYGIRVTDIVSRQHRVASSLEISRSSNGITEELCR